MKRTRYKLENIFALNICLTTFDKLVKKESAILLNSKKKSLYKPQRIPKGQYKMDNPKKLATQGSQNEGKQSTNSTQYVLNTTMRKQTQIT